MPAPSSIVMPRLDLGIHGAGLVTSNGDSPPLFATATVRCLRTAVDARVKPWHDDTALTSPGSVARSGEA
jgi:hypothetical protein